MPTLFEMFAEGNQKPHGGAVMRNYKPGMQDNFQTLPKAVKILLPYLKPEWRIWEPACGKGNIIKTLRDDSRFVFGSDIQDSSQIPPHCWGSWCFLNNPAPFQGDLYQRTFDVIITNPPFSLKDEFLERCIELGKPFALLLPITALEPTSVVTPGKRIKLLQSIDWEVVCPTTRIAFETPSGKPSKPHKGTCWLTHGFNIGRQWTYVDMEAD